MKKQFLTLALLTTVFCLGVSESYADNLNHRHNTHQKIHKTKLAPEEIQLKKAAARDKFEQALGLTDEQKVQLKTIQEDSHKKIKPLFEKKMQKLKEIREIRENDDIKIKVQDKKIEAIMSDLKLIDQEIRQVKQDERKAFKAILTDEQKNKLIELKEKHRPHPEMPRN